MWRSSDQALKFGWALLALSLMTAASVSARAGEPSLSINGYDPVAYFTDGRPVQGRSDYEYLWHKLRWRFASSEHRDMFSKEPNRYAPQYDGYCAMGVTNDAAAHKDAVDPNAWAIVDGKLYLNNNRFAHALWSVNKGANIASADGNWSAVPKAIEAQ